MPQKRIRACQVCLVPGSLGDKDLSLLCLFKGVSSQQKPGKILENINSTPSLESGGKGWKERLVWVVWREEKATMGHPRNSCWLHSPHFRFRPGWKLKKWRETICSGGASSFNSFKRNQKSSKFKEVQRELQCIPDNKSIHFPISCFHQKSHTKEKMS